jgi:hypothetical protein
MTTTSFRWEQNGAGGEHGAATYFPGMSHEVTVTLPTFEQAHTLSMCIQAAIAQARWAARKGLLTDIGRIEP